VALPANVAEGRLRPHDGIVVSLSDCCAAIAEGQPLQPQGPLSTKAELHVDGFDAPKQTFAQRST
jgi:hypothetical protein